MKTNLLLRAAIVLMLAGSISSCTSKSSSIEEIIKPVVPDNDVKVFFENYLPVYSFPLSECFFFDKEDNENKCVVINNVDEFRNIFSCPPIMLPEIDFTSYTLIVGQHRVPWICEYIVEQEIVQKSEKVTLNLRWSCPDGAYASFGTLSYWGIYPKIPVNTIQVNIINQ
jgi:hypothetical protein